MSNAEQETYFNLLDGFQSNQTDQELVVSLRDYFKVDYLQAKSILLSWKKISDIRQAQKRRDIRQRLTKH